MNTAYQTQRLKGILNNNKPIIFVAIYISCKHSIAIDYFLVAKAFANLAKSVFL